MAEEYLKKIGGDRFEVESAGLEPTSVNPLVIAAMKEEGIDLSTKKTQAVWNLFREGKFYNYVITVCDRKNEKQCPIFPKPFVQLKWSFPDPESFSGNESQKMEQIRSLRDAIRSRIEKFVEEVNRS
jgi:arsenate reductase